MDRTPNPVIVSVGNDARLFAVSQHGLEVTSTLLSDASTSCEEPSIRSRLTVDTSHSSMTDSADSPPVFQTIPSIAYVPWILLGVLGIMVIALVLSVGRPAKQVTTVDYPEPNFDSVKPIVTPPPKPLSEGPTIREEEDAFIIEDPIEDIVGDIVEDPQHYRSNDPLVEEMDVTFVPHSSEPAENEDAVVDLGETNSGSSLQGSMVAVFVVACPISLYRITHRLPSIVVSLPEQVGGA